MWRAECGICVSPLDPEEIAEAIQFIVEHHYNLGIGADTQGAQTGRMKEVMKVRKR